MKPHATPRWARLVTTTVLIGLVAAGCGASDESVGSSGPADTPTTVDQATDSTEVRVLSAQDGAAARRRYVPLEPSTESSTLAASGAIAADATTMDCPTAYVPTADEVAEANAANQGLVDAFDRFGIESTSSTDEFGFLAVDYAYDDVVAQSVADSYWAAIYPPLPIPQEELDAIVAQNDIVAAQLDAAGITYERTTDESGYEYLEYDFDDPAAQTAVDAAWVIISPPQPPSAEQLAQQDTDNARLMSAFDDAGIAYELVTDELGWAWVEWDSEDPTTAERYAAIVDELYPPIAIDPVQECMILESSVAIDEPTLDAAPGDVARDDSTDDSIVLVAPVDDEPSADRAAQRAADVEAMVAGFGAAAVDFEVIGEAPWQSVSFDLDDDAAVPVIVGILAARG